MGDPGAASIRGQLADDVTRIARGRLVTEWPNVATAVERAGPHRRALTVEIARALWPCCEHSAFSANLITWAEEALAEEGSDRAPLYALRGLANAGRGLWNGYFDSMEFAREQAELEKDLVTLGRVLLHVAVTTARTDPDRAFELLGRTEDTAASTGDPFVLSCLDLAKIFVLFDCGRLREAARVRALADVHVSVGTSRGRGLSGSPRLREPRIRSDATVPRNRSSHLVRR